MLLIPAIDLKDGRCVRLLKGVFDDVTHYHNDPVELAARYRDAGASWLHVVDLDGAREGRQGNREVIRELAAASGLRVQVGGGLRTAEDVEAMLAAGVSRAVIGSVAMTGPEETRQWLKRFGAECVVLAFDVRLDETGLPRPATHGWQRQTEHSLWDVLGDYGQAGLRHVLCTDIDRDGALTGPSIDLYRECMRRFPGMLFQASGGVRHVQDLALLAETGVAGAISGKALLEGLIDLQEAGPFLQNA